MFLDDTFEEMRGRARIKQSPGRERLQGSHAGESARWLETQIRKRLTAAVRAAERALALAREKRHMSEGDVSLTLQRLGGLRDEISALGE
jgi:hypothetical protein